MSGAEMLKKYKNGTLTQEEITGIKKERSSDEVLKEVLKNTMEVRLKNLFMI